MLTVQRANDPLLEPLLEAETAEERQRAIAELLENHAYDRIDRILAAKFRQSSRGLDERHDLRAEIILRLVTRLHRLAADPGTEPLASFPDYVAVVTLNAFDELLRRLFPNRTSFRNRIRYRLRSDPKLAIWSVGDTVLAGLAAWRNRPDRAVAVAPSSIAGLPAAGDDLPGLMVALFECVGGPIAFDDLVSLLAGVLGITDRAPDSKVRSELVALSRHPSENLERLQYLGALWDEICALPLPQRIALLLNARDASGESVTHFLPPTGVATVRQIAAAMAMDARNLAELWPGLPLDDLRIAEILRVRRQQVINLRRAARERLTRRMRDHGKSPGSPK
jgi:hypothetical protein